MANWTPIDVGMPPESVVVDAIAPQGEILRLVWAGRLWRFPDGSQYVWFTPTYWRPPDDPPGNDL
ncbi:MAG TPA: hypothetical protein VHR66_05680 [Gemmataceae bacterium]|nr:hypothetical protein [Gemmataceae bacterium]